MMVSKKNPSRKSRARAAARSKAESDERCAKYKAFKVIDHAYKTADLNALLIALGDRPDFPNCLHPADLGLSDFPLEYAIYWSPLSFIELLLAHGANPNYPDRAGFPSLIAALSAERPDRLDIVRLLLSQGADPQQRGINDWTSLHHAVSLDDAPAIELLLGHGADPEARTRIDDYATPLEQAEKYGRSAAARALKKPSERCSS